MSLVCCSICGELFDPDRSAALPFCSERCRRVDLERWLDEQYGYPLEPEGDSDENGRHAPDC
ncbi:MAG: DNA gyrase inhibitor YacG [Planctomycetota bacterium]|jgi:endogenous inhibitor of DNA gyrase (YacG/DUF329 family)